MKHLITVGLVFLFVGMFAIPTKAKDHLCVVPPTDSVSAHVAKAVYEMLERSQALPGDVNCWGITNVTELSEDEYTVSLVGLDRKDGKLQDNVVWSGMAAVTRQDGQLVGVMQTESEFVETIQEMPIDPETLALMEGTGGVSNLDWFMESPSEDIRPEFPFANGTSAIYGIRGLHASGGNMFAVDFLGYSADGIMPNAVYAAAPGVVTNICRDGTQMNVWISFWGYFHLVNNPNITEGQYFAKHDYIGQLVTGSFDDDCGWADQQQSHYHLHFAFVPRLSYLQLENWRLDIDSQEWTYADGTTRSTGQCVGPADWNGVNPVPCPAEQPPEGTPIPGGTPTPPIRPPQPGAGSNGSNFWTFIIGGVRSIVDRIASALPQHQSIELAMTVSQYAVLPVQVMYVTGVMNYTLAFTIVALILVLEMVRFVYALWMWVKNAIPFA